MRIVELIGTAASTVVSVVAGAVSGAVNGATAEKREATKATIKEAVAMAALHTANASMKAYERLKG